MKNKRFVPYGYGFGQIGQAAGTQGNQVLGNMFGTEILPGVYTNSNDQMMESLMRSE